MPESLFKLQLYLNRDSSTGVFQWILQDFQFTRFYSFYGTPLDDWFYLNQLLTLYFAIIYSWQLSSSEKSLAGKEIIHIFQSFYRFRFLLQIYFFHFLWQMSVCLDGYANRMLYSEQSTVLLARRHLNTMLLTNFETLNSISKIFQEIHDLLVLTDALIICIYLRTTDRHFRDQGNVCHPTWKLLKCDLDKH